MNATRYIVLLLSLIFIYNCGKNDYPFEGNYKTYIDDKLNVIKINNDSICLNKAFYKFSNNCFTFSFLNDTIIFKGNYLICRSSQGACINKYLMTNDDINESVHLTLVSDSLQNFRVDFSGKYYLKEHFLKENSWDSLYFYVYSTDKISKNSSVRSISKLYKENRFVIEKPIKDSYKIARCTKKLPSALFNKLDKEISTIDSSYFRLSKPEFIIDAYITQLRIYRDNTSILFTGFDFPILYQDLNNYLRSYKKSEDKCNWDTVSIIK